MISKMQKTWKIGLLMFNLIVLAGFALAAWPGDLTFTTNTATETVGNEFVVRLQISPSGGPMDPFSTYNNVSINFSSNIYNLSEELYQDLSSYGSDTFTWHLNSTGTGASQINVSVDGTQTTFATITINAAVANPQLVATIPAIADNRIIGNAETVTVQIDNTGAGDAKDIVGYLSSQKADLNTTSFSIANLAAAGSTTFDVQLTPSQAGNGNLLVDFSSYKKSDDTLLTSAHGDYDATSDTEAFTVNGNPSVNLPASIYIGDSGTNSLDLDDYVTDADTALADLTWSCGDDNANITLDLNAITHLLNLTAENGSYSGVLTCNVTDSVVMDTDSMIINVHRVNDPPTFTSTAVTSVYLGDEYSYDVDASDEEGDTFTFSLTTAPDGMIISENSGVISWTPASTGSQSVTVKVVDSQSNINLQSFTIEVDERPASSSGGSGGKPKAAQETASWPVINAETPVTMTLSDDEISVSEIEIATLADVNDAYIRIEKTDVLPQSMQDSAPDKIYQYFLIVNLNIDDEDIEDVKFRFDVPINWMNSEGVSADKIVLKRYHENRWNDLKTSITAQNSKKVSYEAVSPGFSYFAVGVESGLQELAEEKKEEVKEEQPAEEDKQEEKKEQPAEQKEESPAEEKGPEEEQLEEGVTKEEYSKLPLILTITAIVIVIAALIITGLTGKKNKKNRFTRIKESIVNFFVEEEKAPKKKAKKKRK